MIKTVDLGFGVELRGEMILNGRVVFVVVVWGHGPSLVDGMIAAYFQSVFLN
jgi:hypothetical protein